MSTQSFHGLLRNPSFQFRPNLAGLLLFGAFITALGGVSYAQVATNITGDGTLGTAVTQNGNIHDITGGTRPGSGPNLFHSFGEFSVGEGDIANFKNDSMMPTTSVLGRVTGGNISNIFGTIQTTDFGSANLFLMNPAGWVFGPNAALNVAGSVNFTTADYLKQSDGVRFTALPSDQDSQLSIAAITAFGFLDASPAPIIVDGGTLSVTEGHSISLVSGDITIGSGLNAPGGEIRLASVKSPGEVLHASFDSAPNVNGDSFTDMGAIVLQEGAMLDVSSDAAGTVLIRGGELMMTNATISADTVNTNGAPTAIDIQVTGDISIMDTQGNPAISARTTGSGDPGEVRISSNNLEATSTALTTFALIDTHTSGSGTAGNVNIAAPGNLNVNGVPAGGRTVFIDSGTIGFDGGNGGEVAITAGNVELQDTFINTGDFIARILGEFATGSGGNATIAVDTLRLTRSTIATDGFFVAKAGDLTISARDFQMNNSSQLSLLEFGGGGVLTITVDSLISDNSAIEVETVDGRGEGIPWTGVTITGDVIELRNGSTVRSQTVGNGAAGDIQVTATDRFILSDDPATEGGFARPSGLFTNSRGNVGLGDRGDAGAITIETPKLEISGGARIDSTTQSSGRGGDVTIIATDSISLSGERPNPVNEVELFGLGSSRRSGIFSRTVGSDFCTGSCGDAGNISITTGSFNVADGAAVDSGTTSTGRGGTITVNASENISISGTLDDGMPGGIFSRSIGDVPDSGDGGNISLMTEQNFSLKNGAAVSASSTGPGNSGKVTITADGNVQTNKGTISTFSTFPSTSADQAIGGDIDITAGQNVTLVNDTTISATSSGLGDAGDITVTSGNNINVIDSTISTEAAQASGGDIKLTAPNNVQIINSEISSSVNGPPGSDGGNIEIDPIFILIQNSRILARAVGGRGGNIILTATGAIIIDDINSINADSERGLNGTVTVNSPTAVLAEVIAPLPKNFVRLANLFGERCAAQKGGQFSSFTQGGPDGLPPAPGGFLPSPLMFSNPGAPLSSALPSSKAAVLSSSLPQLRLGMDPGQVDSGALPSINLLPEFGCAAA